MYRHVIVACHLILAHTPNKHAFQKAEDTMQAPSHTERNRSEGLIQVQSFRFSKQIKGDSKQIRITGPIAWDGIKKKRKKDS